MQAENRICQHSSLAHSRGGRECDFHRSSAAQWKVSQGPSCIQGLCWASGGIWVRCQRALGDLLPPPHQRGLSSRCSEPPGAPEAHRELRHQNLPNPSTCGTVRKGRGGRAHGRASGPSRVPGWEQVFSQEHTFPTASRPLTGHLEPGLVLSETVTLKGLNPPILLRSQRSRQLRSQQQERSSSFLLPTRPAERTCR